MPNCKIGKSFDTVFLFSKKVKLFFQKYKLDIRLYHLIIVIDNFALRHKFSLIMFGPISNIKVMCGIDLQRFT